MSKVIILNGPPGVGKDTIGRALAKQFPIVQLFEFKDALRLATWNYYVLGKPEREIAMPFYKFCDLANDRELKEKPHWCLDFKTPRNAMIHVSEEVYKPIYGDDYFGVKAAIDIEKTCNLGNVAAFTDGGFREEIEVLKERRHRVVVARLHREGFTFDGDSRSYLDWPESVDIHLEDGNVQFAVDEIAALL